MTAKLVVLILGISCVLYAREPRFYEKGTLVEMNATSCGYEEKGAKDISGTLLGTDSAHTKTLELLCQEYVLRTDRIVYRIRPKDEKHARLLPIGSLAEFRIAKDRMYVRVAEVDDKERQFVVTSMVQPTGPKAAK